MNNNGKFGNGNSLTYPAGIAVMIVWAFSAIGGFFTGDWTPLTITTPVMLILAGYAFGIKITRGGKDSNGK